MLLDVSYSTAQQHSRLCTDILVTDSYLSTQRLDKSVEAAEKRRLSRPALADESNGASSWDIDTDVIECDYGAETMRDVPGGERRRHGLKTDSDSAWPLCYPLFPDLFGLGSRRLDLLPRVGWPRPRAAPKNVDNHQIDKSEGHEHRLRQRKETTYPAPGDQLTDCDERGSPKPRFANETPQQVVDQPGRGTSQSPIKDDSDAPLGREYG